MKNHPFEYFDIYHVIPKKIEVINEIKWYCKQKDLLKKVKPQSVIGAAYLRLSLASPNLVLITFRPRARYHLVVISSAATWVEGYHTFRAYTLLLIQLKIWKARIKVFN